MDINAISKSLVIVYYLTSLHFLKTTQFMVKDGNIQKNIRHSRSRPYYLIDNRHISESATRTPNIIAKSPTNHMTLSNQTIDSNDKTFYYFFDTGEPLPRGENQVSNQQVIDVEDDRRVKNLPQADQGFYSDSSKIPIAGENFSSEPGGNEKTLHTNNSMFYNLVNDTGNNTFIDVFTHKAKDISYDNKKEEIDIIVKENVNDSDQNNEDVNMSEEFPQRSGHVDIVTRFLRIVESQHLLGENCTAGTDLNLGEGVVDRYAQERFRIEADVAVNRANMLTRLWKYSDHNVVMSEYFLHASVFSMVEFDDDIFAAGNCYDQYQYKDYILFCPYAYRLPEGQILVKDLAVEYKYLSNTSEWFYIARKNAENVIKNYNQFSKGE